MRAMSVAFVATILIAVGAYYTLEQMGFSAAERDRSDAVRLDTD